MRLDPNDFDKLEAPWEEIQPPAPAWDEQQTIAKLDEQAHAAAALGDAGRAAAIGLVVAVGNYEYVGLEREAVIQKCRELLDEIQGEKHSWRWG